MKTINFKYVLVFFIFISIVFSFQAYKKENTDFRAYYVAGKRIVAKSFGVEFADTKMISGNGIISYKQSMYNHYESTPFKYPLITAYFFAPFSFSNYNISSLTWYLTCQLALIFSLIYLRSHLISQLRIPERISTYATLATYLILFRFYLYDMKNLQVNFLILLCMTFFIIAKNDWIKGSALAFAISFKLFPIVLLLFLIIGKRWKLLAKTFFIGVVLIILPVISYGFSLPALIGEMRHYLEFMASDQHIFPADPSYIHPSIDSFLVRLLMVLPGIKVSLINIVTLSAKTTWVIILIVKLILLAPIVFFQWHSKSMNTDRYMFLFSSLYLAYSLFINPLAWKHAYVCLTPLLLYILTAKIRPLIIPLAISIILLAFTSRGVIGGYQQVIATFSPVVWGTLLLMLIAMLVKESNHIISE